MVVTEFSSVLIAIPLILLLNAYSSLKQNSSDNQNKISQKDVQASQLYLCKMAPIASSNEGYILRAGPKPCMEFFQDLMFDIHDSLPADLSRFPTKDSLTWAVQECPMGMDSLYDAYLYAKDEKKTAYAIEIGRFGSEFDSRPTKGSPLTNEILDLLAPTNTASTPTSTGIKTPEPNKNFPKELGIVMAVVIVTFFVMGLVGACTIYNRRRKQRRDVERNARLRRVLEVTDPKGRAEETVRGQWRATASRQEEAQTEQRQSAQGFELQTMSRLEVQPTQDDRVMAAILDAKNEQLKLPERAFAHRSRY
ncbi:hypothetical protein BDZ45DRAFT_202107 [Acephala macrosclerotiorum]|nr:hypothetical protein BDZ45DRAFT_202107 [Acephala macrosclerotiorum]